MDEKLIYIADDELNIRKIIESFLKKEGYRVRTFSSGDAVLEAFTQVAADMLIIDIMMPGLDGYSLCAAIRKISNVPIIMVSAKDNEPDKIAGLTLGSDDYLTKPFSPMELVARVKSIFRRIEFDKSRQANSKVTHIADIAIYPDGKHATCNGVDLNLTVMEFNLISYLVENKNRAVSRDELLNKLWGFETKVDTRATDDMVKRIRKKLSDVGSSLQIETVWGFGFKIKDDSL